MASSIKKTSVIIIGITIISLFLVFSWVGNAQMQEQPLKLQDIESSIMNGESYESIKRYLAEHNIEFFTEKSEELSINERSKIDFDFAFRIVFVAPQKIKNKNSSIVEKHNLFTLYFDNNCKVLKLTTRDAYSSF